MRLLSLVVMALVIVYYTLQPIVAKHTRLAWEQLSELEDDREFAKKQLITSLRESIKELDKQKRTELKELAEVHLNEIEQRGLSKEEHSQLIESARGALRDDIRGQFKQNLLDVAVSNIGLVIMLLTGSIWGAIPTLVTFTYQCIQIDNGVRESLPEYPQLVKHENLVPLVSLCVAFSTHIPSILYLIGLL